MLYRNILLVALLGFGLAGCAPTLAAGGPASKAVPSDLDRVTYAISSCRGTCPAYTVTIAADGNAFFVGERNTKVPGQAVVDGTPMLFSALKIRLAAIRPKEASQSVSHENCSVYTTDQQVVTVTWGWGFDQTNTLSFDLGCHGPEHASTRAALGDVRKLLPIDHLVGRATEF
jgi:hypothetical protein